MFNQALAVGIRIGQVHALGDILEEHEPQEAYGFRGCLWLRTHDSRSVSGERGANSSTV